MTDEPPITLKRSALFVPGDKPRALEKAPGLGADILILDLEDAVAPDNKPAARTAAPAAIAGLREGGAVAVLRVAEPGSADLAADLECAVAARPDAILVAKAEDPDAFARIRDTLDKAGAKAGLSRDQTRAIDLWAMVESPRAILALDAFITAAPALGLSALVAGTNDLAEQLRLPDHARRQGCVPHLARLVLAARAGGLTVLDGVYNAYTDAAGFAEEARQGRALGFDGKTLIHPSQIAPANAAFGPGPDEIDRAQRVIAAFDDPANAGKGAVALDGRMVEAMHLRQARAVLAAGENDKG